MMSKLLDPSKVETLARYVHLKRYSVWVNGANSIADSICLHILPLRCHHSTKNGVRLMNMTSQLVASFQEGDFATIRPFPHPTQRSIMPVVAMKGQYLRGVGTCFAISSQGLVMTARHVVEDALGIDDQGMKMDSDQGIGAVYIAEPGPKDIEDIDAQDLTGGPLTANKIYYSRDHDIALMILNLPTHGATGKRLQMPQLKLGMQVPKKGATCVGLGYHAMDWKQATGAHTHEVAQSYSASQGIVSRVHFPKRDSMLMNYPCFQTDCKIVGGMSGGPIIDCMNGSVIGVSCRSFELPDGEDHISHASFASLSLFLTLEATDANGKQEKKFLYDFVRGGAVATDGQFVVIADTKEGRERTLEIQFDGVRVSSSYTCDG